ncbi:hypothetical protein [Candidatus Poriferisodalis sp.]|uniref:hypothetical protein n=1 Tax=Candidatus Poriferisodalis sp. TaxID=3101277 RepID=UPI003C702462
MTRPRPAQPPDHEPPPYTRAPSEGPLLRRIADALLTHDASALFPGVARRMDDARARVARSQVVWCTRCLDCIGHHPQAPHDAIHHPPPTTSELCHTCGCKAPPA